VLGRRLHQQRTICFHWHSASDHEIQHKPVIDEVRDVTQCKAKGPSQTPTYISLNGPGDAGQTGHWQGLLQGLLQVCIATDVTSID
jgi:hypothetical protein